MTISTRSCTVHEQRRLALTAALALLFALAILVAGRPALTDPVEFPAAVGRPNIVVLVVDDQELASFNPRVMPQTHRLLVEPGTTFEQNIVPTPQCCPFRAAFISGEYGHNNGILSNRPGYPSLVDPGNVLPVWLKRGGYRTALIGKWLNGYEDAVDDIAEPAPGWDDWQASVTEGYYDYFLSDNGEIRGYGDRPSDYHTEVVTDRALDAIDRYSPGERPFFLWVAYWAPHKDLKRIRGRCDRAAIPAKRDLNAFKDVKLPRPPSFDELNTRDKPEVVRRLPKLDDAPLGVKIENKLGNYSCRLGALQAVDRSVASVVGALERSGELENTVIVYTSDNGFFLGEHRIPSGKTWAYEEGIHVPLVMRAPESVLDGAEAPSSVDDLVASIDLAPTFLELAGAEPCATDGDCRTLDGRSLVPLLEGERGAWPFDRGIALEAEETGEVGSRFPCKYQGIRTPRDVLVVHEEINNPATRICEPTNDHEYYDLRRDPFQLLNTWSLERPHPRQQALLSRMINLRDCSGIQGRDPLPPSGHWCE